jgi:hypothetical protein
MAPADFAWADGLRRAHYPPERNRVPAHITLFHQLPPSAELEVLDAIRRICAGRAPAAHIGQVRDLGGGVAFDVDSPELLAIRADLAGRFHGLLGRQDSARPRLHITVQNKVPAAVARALAEALKAGFRPRTLGIKGLAAWRYQGGPWELIREVRFRG